MSKCGAEAVSSEFNILHIRCRQILSPEIWSDWSFWYLRLHDYPRNSLPRCCWLSTHPPSTQMSRLGMTSWSQRRGEVELVWTKWRKFAPKAAKATRECNFNSITHLLWQPSHNNTLYSINKLDRDIEKFICRSFASASGCLLWIQVPFYNGGAA